MYVYFLKTIATGQHGSTYRYKIGHAANVTKRIGQLQTGCPTEIHLFGTLKCESKDQAADIERQLHAFFADKRKIGEWFQFSSRQAWAIRLLLRDWPVSLPIHEYMTTAIKLSRSVMDALYQAGLPAWAGLSPIDSLNRKELIDRVVDIASVPRFRRYHSR
jgi:hypothetical protein